MVPPKKVYGVLGFVLIFSLWALAAPGEVGGSAPQDKEYPAITFYVA
jgi:hypothetical protein